MQRLSSYQRRYLSMFDFVFVIYKIEDVLHNCANFLYSGLDILRVTKGKVAKIRLLENNDFRDLTSFLRQ